MTPPTDARCPNCGGYPRTREQVAWRRAHPRSQRRWCKMRMHCLYSPRYLLEKLYEGWRKP